MPQMTIALAGVAVVLIAFSGVSVRKLTRQQVRLDPLHHLARAVAELGRNGVNRDRRAAIRYL